MNLVNEPIFFSTESIEKICKLKNAVYVCDTTLKSGANCSVFYGEETHPVSKSRYFGLYIHPTHNQLMICNAADIEDIKFDAVIADNGDVIYSRHRHDFRTSPDGSVWIDGGRSYTRSGVYPADRWVTLFVKDGVLTIGKSNKNKILDI